MRYSVESSSLQTLATYSFEGVALRSIDVSPQAGASWIVCAGVLASPLHGNTPSNEKLAHRCLIGEFRDQVSKTYPTHSQTSQFMICTAKKSVCECLEWCTAVPCLRDWLAGSRSSTMYAMSRLPTTGASLSLLSKMK